jgi:hypothetical protein
MTAGVFSLACDGFRQMLRCIVYKIDIEASLVWWSPGPRIAHELASLIKPAAGDDNAPMTEPTRPAVADGMAGSTGTTGLSQWLMGSMHFARFGAPQQEQQWD